MGGLAILGKRVDESRVRERKGGNLLSRRCFVVKSDEQPGTVQKKVAGLRRRFAPRMVLGGHFASGRPGVTSRVAFLFNLKLDASLLET